MERKFVHLSVHSEYSIVDGIVKIPKLLDEIEKNNIPAVALTDFNNLFGLVKFYNACLVRGIKPIIGTDILVKSCHYDGFFNLTLLAMNNQGYSNIIELISKAYKRGHVNNSPVIDQAWLKNYCDGLIVLSGGLDGDLSYALSKNDKELIDDIILFYEEFFQDRFYLELSRLNKKNENKYIQEILELSPKKNLPLVATNKVRFIKEGDYDAHDIRVCIHDGDTLDNPKRIHKYTKEQYLKSEQEMFDLFYDIPEAIQNTINIAQRCSVFLTFGDYFLPDFPTGNLKIEDYLIDKAQIGLEKRLTKNFPDINERNRIRGKYEARLNIELEVINNMGFPGYFLVVMEFIQWSKTNFIPVGPGRGSGAGSLVAYALDITDLDPLEYDLLFERFLNPERVSMPDFDIDFCMDKRDLVIEHVSDIYGKDAVSQIITFGTMAAKAVIRDVGRVLGHPYGFVDRIAKLIPLDPGMTLSKAFEEEKQLVEAYESDEDVQFLIDICRSLEGVVRNAGKHAGGVVISPTKISDFSPVYCDSEGRFPVTQFDKNDIETAGLVKFDFLGLRTLTIIDWTLKLIRDTLDTNIEIEKIALDDKKAFSILKKAQTTAVFQLESRGMKDLIKRLQPDCFEDIIALVALFRPGPLQSGMVDNFIDRKHGREKVSYPDAKWQHSSLKEILNPTYGIILYQEQVMQIAQTLSGYSLGEADILRRAMGKKKPEEMAKQREVFKQGAIKNNIDGDLAMKIFDLVEKFAGYGFNKSHSAAYALVSYQTLWLKAHFPSQFMAAVMSADMDNTEKIITLTDECRQLGIKILLPNANKSLYEFSVNQDNEIIFGLGAIKGVGENSIINIVKSRNLDGHYKDLLDFCKKVDLKKVNKKLIEKLIKSGAMDCLNLDRDYLFSSLDETFQEAEQYKAAKNSGQSDLFGLSLNVGVSKRNPDFNQYSWSEIEKLNYERELLGMFLSGHPMDYCQNEVKNYITFKLDNLRVLKLNKQAVISGLLVSIRHISTRKGIKLTIATIEDSRAKIDVVLFDDTYEQFKTILSIGSILCFVGNISKDDYNGNFKITAKSIYTLTEMREQNLKNINIVLNEKDLSSDKNIQLKNILENYFEGSVPLNIEYQKDNFKVNISLGMHWSVTPNDDLIKRLENLVGKNNIKFNY